MAFDTVPLQRDLTRQERARYRALARSGAFGAPSRGNWTTWLFLVVFLLFALGMLPFFDAIGRATHASLLYRLWPLVIAIAALGFMVAVARQQLATARTWPRVAAFAERNGLRFRIRDRVPGYPGMLFSRASGGSLVHHVVAPGGAFSDCGTVEWSEGSGEDRESYSRTYIALRLPRQLPNLVLKDRRHNGGLTGVVTLAGDQRVSFGEPFDSRFTAYAPAGYATDAYLLLPPHVMEQLMALPEGIDVEVVDDWMFLVGYGNLAPSQRETWTLVGQLQDGLGARVQQLWDRYRDSRLVDPAPVPVVNGAPGAWATPASRLPPSSAPAHAPWQPLTPGYSGIAPGGRRLRTTWSIRGLFGFALVIAFWVLNHYHVGFLHWLPWFR